MIDIAGGTRVSIFGGVMCLAVFGLLLPATANDSHLPIPEAPAARAGCRLSGIVYDTKLKQTTFSYDCNTRQPDGWFGYIEHRPGNYFKNKG